jgi:hypothetical protein
MQRKCHGSTPRHSVRPCPLAGGQGQWPVTWLSTDGRPLSCDSRQGWLGTFPASFLLPLCFLVYVSLYSLGPYLRMDCYSRLRFLTGKIGVEQIV